MRNLFFLLYKTPSSQLTAHISSQHRHQLVVKSRTCILKQLYLKMDSQEICNICFEQQEQLLADGDGSQVICTHNIIDNDSNEAVSSEEGDVAAKKKRKMATAESSGSVKRKSFLSDAEFDRRADDKLKRKLIPIKKWRELIIRKTYRALKLHQMKVKFNCVEKDSNYAEMEDNSGTLINAWLTPTIYEELSKCDLTKDIYIYKTVRKGDQQEQ